MFDSDCKSTEFPRGQFVWLNPEKIAENITVNLALHRTNPVQIEGGWWQPARLTKFIGVFEADGSFRFRELGEKIMLFLAIKAVLFPTIQEKIAIGTLLRNNAIVLRFQPELFLDFAMKCVQQCFVLLDTSLRELPTAGDIASLADKDLPPGISQNNCGIRTVRGHIRSCSRNHALR